MVGFFAFFAVTGVVERDEFPQVFQFQRVLFQRMVNIGAIVVKPDFFCPGVFAAGFVVEEDDVCFYAVGVKDTGG